MKGKTVILVDDGMATGANMRVAVDAMKRQQASRIVVAAPVASGSAYEALKRVADEMVCVDVPVSFPGVGGFYEDFSQVPDAEVKLLLNQAPQHTTLAEENP